MPNAPCKATEYITERGMLTVGLLRKFLNEPVARESFIAEGTIKGLFLLRRPALKTSRHVSRACWILRWNDGGKAKKMVIGDGRSIPLDAARKAAQTHLAVIIQGRDPAQERRERRERMTVAKVWKEYTADPRFTSKTTNTQYKDRNRYGLHVADRIGSKFIDELDLQAIENFVNAICTDKRTGRRGRRLGGKGAAKKVIRLLSAMTSWALKRKWTTSNPFSCQTLWADGTRTGIVEGPAFQSIFVTLEAMESNGQLPAVKARALRVIWATGARLSEVTGLRWRHVRLDDERIVFDADEHKGGRVAVRRGRQGAPRIIDLPPIAYEAIAAQLPDDGAAPPRDSLVFPPMVSHADQLELTRAWRKVRKAARLPANIVIHSARHSLGTAAALAGMTGSQLAAVLGHAQTRTTERYSDLARSRKQRFGRIAFDAAMGSRCDVKLEHNPSSNVVSIRER
jgi:integrase